MELQTILTVKQPALEAILHSLRLYMEEDECVCDAVTARLPLFAGSTTCPPDCDRCTWCIGRTALRGIGQRVDAEKEAQRCDVHL